MARTETHMMINYLTLTEKKKNFILLAILIFSLTIKVVIFFLATDPIIFNKYPYFAEQISKGGVIGERILDLSPAYLYITVLFFKIFGPNWEALALVQILLGSLNCIFIYFIGARIFGTATGLLAAAILMLYGNMTLVELTLEPETFVLFFNSLALLALIKSGNEGTPPYRSWKWFLAGMLIGLSAITKPNALLIIPGALIWIVLSVKTRETRCRAMASILLGVFLLVAPVTIRNFIQFNDFILITADGGKVFFHGNGPGATGMERADLPNQGFIEEKYSTEPDYAHALFRKTARAISKASLKPSECSDFWFVYTIKHIQANPPDALFLEWKKFCLFWNNYEVHDLDSTYKNYTNIQKWPLIPYGVISALSILGMGIMMRRMHHAFLLYWMIAIYLFSVLVFFAASRYRIPAAPFLCLFASQFLIRLFHFNRHKDIPRTLCWLMLIPISLAWTYLPFHGEIKQFDQWQQAARIHYSLMGKTLFAKGKYQEAIKEFEKVISVDQDFTPAYNYLGKSYAILGKIDKAQSCFQRVIDLTPTLDEGYLNMGLLLELTGESSKALPYFEKALSINSNNTKAKEHIGKLKTLSE
jgi:4-amino-4-deoxy-L-arabinose transferase-like glycosyltransferase